MQFMCSLHYPSITSCDIRTGIKMQSLMGILIFKIQQTHTLVICARNLNRSMECVVDALAYGACFTGFWLIYFLLTRWRCFQHSKL